jgi:threonine-phosphate decarboxylase
MIKTGHGGNIHLASAELGLPLTGVMDFSASINPLGMPEASWRAITESRNDLAHYPEPFSDTLAARIATLHGIDVRSVLCGNGSTELIYLIARALSPKKVLIPAPTFSEYERACRLVPGCECVKFELSAENNFDVDPDKFIAALHGCDMAFLCNPNNPTGRLVDKKSVRAIANAAERSSCCLVVDEAFIDFTPEQSVLLNVGDSSGLIVLRSLTKFYALAGLRIGYGVFPLPLIERLRSNKEPWSVNALAQRAAIAALGDEAYYVRTMQVMQAEKQFLEQGLKNSGIDFVLSAPNYYLLKMKNAQNAIVCLRSKGILVRDCSNFAGLDETYIRIAVRSRAENAALLQELASCAD